MATLKNLFSRKNVAKTEVEQTYTCNVEDYDETFDIPRLIFKTIGIRLTRKDSDCVRLIWNIFYWIQFAGIVMAGIVEITYIVIVAQLGTFEAAIEIFRMLPCVGYVIIGMTKCYKIVYYRPVYENLVDELRSMWPSGPVNKEEHGIVTNALKHINFVIRGYYWCNIILLVVFMAQPFLAWLKLLTGHDTPRVLPFFYWFPFDPYQPYLHEFLMVFQTWQGYVAVMFLLCGDMLLCIFLSHIATQFDLLSFRIKRLVYVPLDDQLPKYYPLGEASKDYIRSHREVIETYNGEQWEIKYQRKLHEIICRHRALIRLTDDVERMNSFSLLLNFCNSSIIICFCGFCCVIVEKVTEVVYKSFLVTALVQTSLLCWYGQRLLESSLGVSDALYNSGWYKTSKKIRSTIFIMLCRSQKPVKLTTYGFSVLSLASYTTIIKTAWSYFTLLLNVYKQKDRSTEHLS